MSKINHDICIPCKWFRIVFCPLDVASFPKKNKNASKARKQRKIKVNITS